jgi:hypothetical protein
MGSAKEIGSGTRSTCSHHLLRRERTVSDEAIDGVPAAKEL